MIVTRHCWRRACALLILVLLTASTGASVTPAFAAPDVTPPTIVSADLLQTSVAAGESFGVRARATDDVSGVSYVCVSFRWADDRGDSAPSACGSQPTSGTRLAGTFQLEATVSSFVRSGTLRAVSAYAYDQTGKSASSTSLVSGWTVTVHEACTPRPAVTVRSERLGYGQLRVSVTATGAANTISSIRFGQLQNGAIVSQPAVSGANATFVVQRSASGAVTVPFTVTDGCGEWRTFVGAGAGSL